MAAYSILKALLTPPGILILLLIGAFFAARRVLARLLIFVAASILALMSLPVVATLLMTPLEVYAPLDAEALPEGAQAIAVMGAGRYIRAPEYGERDTVDGFSAQRARYAAYLHRASGLPIYVAGGKLPVEKQAISELIAEFMRTDLGVPVAGIETESLTSWENAAYLAPLLARDGIRHVLLVSSAWHLPRGVEAFERAGLKVTAAPTGFVHIPGVPAATSYTDWLPDAKAFCASYYAIHEHLGRVWYQLRYWVQGAPRAPVAGS